ncbi:uncharacterized protein LOC124535377 [Vanessa cardui]|uniref:uncharacterized protein LOC124535377 n=1 Tax=Vanessa cardui TaxID=171605 RepID=UPI001F13DF94|nr:uncharacterized protein LOC124535377 [Vanessa cardui]
MEVAEALLPSLSDESAAMPLAGAASNTTDYNNQKPISRARLPKIEDRDNTAACPAVSSVPPQGSADSESFVPINSVNSSANLEHGRSFVLLGTCVVRARGPNGVFNIRALIDSGAQDSFVTSECVQLLGLPLRRCNITVAGLGQNPIHEVKGMTSFTIQPQNSDQPKFNIQAIVMKSITHKMPSVKIPQIVKTNYRHLVLADNNFDKSGDIDLLIGAELFHNIYDGQRLDVGPGLPVALHSVFGWVITGRFDPEYQTPACTTALVASTLDLDNIVKQFWEVEEPPKARVTNPENENCEKLYTDLVRRNEDGRYVVPILLKEEREELGDSFHGSLSRLYNLEKRFRRHAELKNEYCKFMKEYEDLNHMEVVKMSDKDSRYVIPHHCVLRPDSATTKLRVVFDASAKTTTGHSLNDIVYTGPKLLNDIVDIITKFRLHPLVFTADISKMYRNIDLRPEDRKYQHILWRNSSTEEVLEYELKTVTYGVSSSPYLAIRTLHQLAKDHGEQWPEAASIPREDVFMDDTTAGAPNLTCALDLKNQLINLLDCGKFELRKWSSNSPEFLAQLPTEHCQVPKSFCDDKNQQTLKILGVQWDPIEDNFTYSQSELNPKCTKRSILSNVARIYDPLGWLTPMVLQAKLIIQELWRLQLNWDDPIPEDIVEQWKEFVAELRIRNLIRSRLAKCVTCCRVKPTPITPLMGNLPEPRVQAVLNSKPLCALSSDPSEVDVLTPGHFLTGGPLVSLPEMPLTEVYLPPRERWQMLQRLTQSFWKVWRNSYLHTLQQRCKWFERQPNVKIDDVVVIVEQNLPPLEWRFGRVTALHPGTDGIHLVPPSDASGATETSSSDEANPPPLQRARVKKLN